jgi:transcriptional/translational regulatory protein YebC/TACO1
MVSLSGSDEEDVLKLIAKMEEEEDVQKVFHNLA